MQKAPGRQHLFNSWTDDWPQSVLHHVAANLFAPGEMVDENLLALLPVKQSRWMFFIHGRYQV